MTAKLLIREVSAREFVQHNGDYVDLYDGQHDSAALVQTAIDRAIAEGERLCAEGNVEAFQVWELRTTRQRVWKLEEVTA